jgi:hypothetical protein
MKAGFELVESDQQVTRKILRALRTEINKKLVRIATPLVPEIRAVIGATLRAQPEYGSLDNGKLAASFGLSDGKTRADAIIEAWINNVSVKTKTAKAKGDQISAGVEITGLAPGKSAFEDITDLPPAQIQTKNGQTLPWLKWLLNEGDKAIILDHDILFAPIGRRRSRSGKAIMIQKQGARWRVPSEFAGTEGDNWITRGLASAGPELESLVTSATQRAFR